MQRPAASLGAPAIQPGTPSSSLRSRRHTVSCDAPSCGKRREYWGTGCCPRPSDPELHTTQTTVTWVLTAYLLSASIMTPLLGCVGDMTGKKRRGRRRRLPPRLDEICAAS